MKKLKEQFELGGSAVARDTAEPDRSGLPLKLPDKFNLDFSLVARYTVSFSDFLYRNDSYRRCVIASSHLTRSLSARSRRKRKSGRLSIVTAGFLRAQHVNVGKGSGRQFDRPLRPARFRRGRQSGRMFIESTTCLRAHIKFTYEKQEWTVIFRDVGDEKRPHTARLRLGRRVDGYLSRCW